jgi:serine/threonine-protein kinase HipA
VQSAKSCGLPDQMVKEVVHVLTDVTASGIDRTLSGLPKGFPQRIAASIANGAKRRLLSLALTASDG